MKLLTAVSILLVPCISGDLSTSSEKPNPQVTTPLGKIEGLYNIANGGRLYESYKGIPYAHPPIGDHRFRVAESVSPWPGVFMAKKFGSPCMQYNFALRDLVDKVEGSEDCLYLNIYTPFFGDATRELLPVMFFIPGGGFLIGSGNHYGPKYLMDENVTLITMNYRLGPLGFLSTEDEIVPGNMGLKDQVIALRWVNDNIRYFGGDPSRITIIGHSAGAASVHYHYLTNLTTGLFQRGISITGSVFHPWSQVQDPLEKAKKLATVVGCPISNIQSMIDCLRDRPAHQVVQAVSNFTGFPYIPPNGWGPSVEKGCDEFTFIDRLPVDIIASGDAHYLPWITGIVSEEALYPMSYLIADEALFQELNNEWEKIAPQLLYYTDTIPQTDLPSVGRSIRHHYLGEERPISRTTFNQTVEMVGDRFFVYATESAAKSMALANRGPVHVYYFTYRGAHSFSETLSGTDENFGVSHGDDLAYVFDVFFDPTTTVEDRAMQQVMINLWVSFATNGTPDMGVEWPSLRPTANTEEYNYLHIARPNEIRMESSSNFGQKEFWQGIGFRENNID